MTPDDALKVTQEEIEKAIQAYGEALVSWGDCDLTAGGLQKKYEALLAALRRRDAAVAWAVLENGSHRCNGIAKCRPYQEFLKIAHKAFEEAGK